MSAIKGDRAFDGKQFALKWICFRHRFSSFKIFLNFLFNLFFFFCCVPLSIKLKIHLQSFFCFALIRTPTHQISHSRKCIHSWAKNYVTLLF